jgi:hypothetical protein
LDSIISMFSLIEVYTQIIYMIDKGDILSIQCKMSLRGPRLTTPVRVSHFMTGSLPPISSSWWPARRDDRHFFFQRNTWCHSPYVTTSLARGWVYSLQLLLVLTSSVILRSYACRTCDHILLSQIRNSPNLECQVPVFIAPRNRVAQLYLQVQGSHFIASYNSQGYGGGIRRRFHMGGQTLSDTVQLFNYLRPG